MKMFGFTLLFAIICLSSFAGDTASSGFKRFTFGVHASPDYCYRSLVSATYSTSWRNDNEIPMYAYSGGVDFSYFVKKHFSISLGLGFSQKGYTTKEILLTDVSSPELGFGKGKFRSNYNYVEIPLKANFIFGKKKLRLLTSLGISPSFLLYQQTNATITYNDGSEEKRKGKPNYIYNFFNLFANGSLGIDYKFGKRSGIMIAPTYCYGLSRTISSYYTEHLWSTGLLIGWHIDL